MPTSTDHAGTARIAYVLLWFPRSTETFIFREVVQLRERGLPILIYSLYGTSLGSGFPHNRAMVPRGANIVFMDLLPFRKNSICRY